MLGATEIGPYANRSIRIGEEETEAEIKPVIIKVEANLQAVDDSNIQVETVPRGEEAIRAIKEHISLNRITTEQVVQ